MFPQPKPEGWWLIVGEKATNRLLAIKRITIAWKSEMKLTFVAPEAPGEHLLTLYLLSDCYFGCDQEYDFTVNLQTAMDDDDDDDEDDDSQSELINKK